MTLYEWFSLAAQVWLIASAFASVGIVVFVWAIQRWMKP